MDKRIIVFAVARIHTCVSSPIYRLYNRLILNKCNTGETYDTPRGFAIYVRLGLVSGVQP